MVVPICFVRMISPTLQPLNSFRVVAYTIKYSESGYLSVCVPILNKYSAHLYQLDFFPKKAISWKC